MKNEDAEVFYFDSLVSGTRSKDDLEKVRKNDCEIVSSLIPALDLDSKSTTVLFLEDGVMIYGRDIDQKSFYEATKKSFPEFYLAESIFNTVEAFIKCLGDNMQVTFNKESPFIEISSFGSFDSFDGDNLYDMIHELLINKAK